MMTDESKIVCPNCGSTRVVPFVVGDLTDENVQLSLQEEIYPAGTIAMDTGYALWCCVDCHQPLEGEQYSFHWDPCPAMERYYDAVEAAFARYKPVSLEEYHILNGRALLKATIQQQFETEATAEVHLEPCESGFAIRVVSRDGNEDVLKHAFFNQQRYEQIIAFAESQSKMLQGERPFFDVRIARDERRFELSLHREGARKSLIVRPLGGPAK